VLAAVHLLADQRGVSLALRRMTLSTAGIRAGHRAVGQGSAASAFGEFH